MKLTTKNAVKVSVNQKAKTIRLTTQYFKTVTEGEATLGKAKNFMILNKNRLDKMIADGYTVVTEERKSEWTPQYIVGDPKVEEEIRAYTERKKRQQAVTFVSGVTVRNQKYGVTAKEVFGETKFEKQQPIDFSKAYERHERRNSGQ